MSSEYRIAISRSLNEPPTQPLSAQPAASNHLNFNTSTSRIREQVDLFNLQLLGSWPWNTYFPHKLRNIYRDSGGVLASQDSVASLNHYIRPTIRRTAFRHNGHHVGAAIGFGSTCNFSIHFLPLHWTLWTGSR